MKKADVKIGRIYTVKVSGRLVPVKIVKEHDYAIGWVGKNMRTGREIRIRSAQRLRREWPGRPVAS